MAHSYDGEDSHPETLRPLADDIAPPESYVRPSRAPYVVAGLVVAIAAVATMFALSSRPKLTATAQAVLDESHQRELAASAASPAPTSSLSAHAEATERLDAALPAAAKACGITLVSGTEIDIRATVDEDGSIERARLTSQPFAGWPMGDCIAQRLAKTKLATHEGGPLPLHARLVAP